MASDRRLPVKPDVRGSFERKTSAPRAAPAHKLADDEGTVIGMKASDLFQPVCECRLRCNCALFNVGFCKTVIKSQNPRCQGQVGSNIKTPCRVIILDHVKSAVFG